MKDISRSSHRDYFDNICSCLPGAPFSGFFQEALCVHRKDSFQESSLFAERMQIFQEDMSVRQTDTIFPGSLFMCLPNRYRIFQILYFWLPNRYRFSRRPFLASEQIPILQELFWLPNRYRFSRITFLITIFQEAFFEHQRTEKAISSEGTPL